MKKNLIKFVSIFICALSFAEGKVGTISKIPHNHASEHGGLVLMFGDYHGEFVNVDSGKSVLLFLSDKMRQSEKPEDFELELSLIEGSKTSILSPVSFENSFKYSLPKKISKAAKIAVKVLRKNPPKGIVTTANPQIVLLKSIPKMKEMDHSAHQGH